MTKTVAVLGYHKIGPPPEEGWDSWYYVPTPVFEAHLDRLIEGGWQPIGPGAFLAGLDDPACLGERSFLVTFDDGYRSLTEHARPVLEAAGVPWVVFVPTAFVGGTNTFDEGAEPTEPICTWSELAAWSRRGVSVQSHGVQHHAMSALSVEDQLQELTHSREQLEAGLEVPVELFAFPYGDAGAEPSAMGARLEKAGYRAAFLYGGGPVEVATADRHLLPRLAMGPDSDLSAMLE